MSFTDYAEHKLQKQLFYCEQFCEFYPIILKIRIYSKSTINHSVKIIKIRCRLEECFQRRKSFLKHDFPLCLLVEFEDRKT